MSTLVNLTANAITLEGFQLTSPTDMLTALSYLVGLSPSPYAGFINCQNVAGTQTWSMQLNNSAQNSTQIGYVNDWVILENSTLAVICPAAEFATLYTQS